VCSVFKDDGGRVDVRCIKKLLVCYSCRMTFYVVECRTCGEGRCSGFNDAVSGEYLVLEHSYLIVFVDTTRSKLWIRSITDRPKTFLHLKRTVKNPQRRNVRKGVPTEQRYRFSDEVSLRFNMKRVKY